jgi:metal-responsive CopG/Arc/MetJ family transcriptional regulator
VTLSRRTLAALDRVARKTSSRSRVIEVAVEAYIEGRARAAHDARDTAILDRIAPEVEDEPADVLALQADL